MRSRILILIFIVILITAATSPAATVTGYVARVSYAAATTRVFFTPRTVPQGLNGRTYIAGQISTSPTNGLLAVKLLGGRYQVSFDPPAGVFDNFTVPDGDGFYNFADLITNLTTFTYTNEPLTRPSARILIGTNLVAVTNNWGLPNESLTLHATSTGGGSMDYTITNSLASTNYVNAATNTLNTSLRAALAQTNAIALTNGSNVFYWNAVDGTWYSPNPVTLADLGGEGSGLTNLNADYISLGTLADARIASTLARDSEVQDATNSLNTTLRSALAQTNVTSANVTTALGYAPQLGSANLSNWSAVAVFSTNGLTGFDAINLTNLQAAQITGLLPMGTVSSGLTNIPGPFLTTNTAARYYSYNGNALTNLSAGNLVSGTNTATIGIGSLVVPGAAGFVTANNGVVALGANAAAAKITLDGVNGNITNGVTSVWNGTTHGVHIANGAIYGSSQTNFAGSFAAARGYIDFISGNGLAIGGSDGFGQEIKIFPDNRNQTTFSFGNANGTKTFRFLSDSNTFSGSVTATNGFVHIPKALSFTGFTNIVLDASLGNKFTLTLTTNCFFATPSNLFPMQEFTIDVRQDSVGGRTVTFTNGGQWKFPSGQILTTTTNAGSWSIFSCMVSQYGTNVAVVQTLNFQ